MILSAADLSARLSHKRNSARETKVKVRQGERTVDDLDRNDIQAGPDLFIRNAQQGRRPGDSDIPDEVKIPATVLARLGINGDTIAQEFGISASQVSNLKNGKTGSDEVQSAVDRAIEGIREKVVNKLDRSLDFVTEDKLLNAKASEVMSVATGLARIIESTAPKIKDNGNSSRVQVVIHGAAQVQMNSYETVEVNG